MYDLKIVINGKQNKLKARDLKELKEMLEQLEEHEEVQVIKTKDLRLVKERRK